MKTNNKLKSLKDVIITSGIVFTSDTSFYHIFKVYKYGVIITDRVAYSDYKYDKIFKELTTKYKVNIIYDYSDLTTEQLDYLMEQDITTTDPKELKRAYIQKLMSF